MTSSGSAAGLGLLSAATWGGSDFVGGIGARRSPALLVVIAGHAFSLLVMLAACFAAHAAVPTPRCLFLAMLGGFEGSLALTVFYRALAMGAMGLTAALTGLLTALVPVVFGLIHDGLPAPVTVFGLGMGCVAIWLISHAPTAKGAGTPPLALLLGALAGVCFGAQMILFKLASSGGILWTTASARAAGVVALLIVIAVRPPKGKWKGFWLTGIAAGMLDTIGILIYLRATQLGRLDVASLVASLYPGGTILLAALLLREWPTRRQMAGMALALAAVALLSV